MLSDRIERLTESATIAMAKKARQLKSEGKDIISLSLGEPDFDTPDFIKSAAKEGIDQNYTRYMPVNGYDDLREAISNKFKRDNGLEYSKDQIVVSTGAKQSIANLVMSVVNPGDEVIIPTPFWVSYVDVVKFAEGIPVFVESTIETDFKISAEQLEAAITDKTKLMMFSSPCNPSGSVYSKEELGKIAKVLEKHPNIIAMSDEIYEHIVFEGKHASLAQFDSIKDQVVTVNGVSKAFAMTGWRIGYIGAPTWIASACTKVQGQFTSGTSSVSQRAAIAALNTDPECTSQMREAFHKRRDLVIGLLKEIPGVKVNTPPGAFYLFPDVSHYFGKQHNGKTISGPSDLSEFLLSEAFVAVVSGEAFGDPNCIRFSYAADEKELIKAVSRIKEALTALN